MSGERCDPIFTPLLLGEPHSPLLSIIMTPPLRCPLAAPSPTPPDRQTHFFSFSLPSPPTPQTSVQTRTTSSSSSAAAAAAALPSLAAVKGTRPPTVNELTACTLRLRRRDCLLTNNDYFFQRRGRWARTVQPVQQATRPATDVHARRCRAGGGVEEGGWGWGIRCDVHGSVVSLGCHKQLIGP